MIDFAGQRKAVPLRMGRVVEKSGTRGDALMRSYNASSTARGEPAVARYAGLGVGMGLRAFERSSGEILAECSSRCTSVDDMATRDSEGKASVVVT